MELCLPSRAGSDLSVDRRLHGCAADFRRPGHHTRIRAIRCLSHPSGVPRWTRDTSGPPSGITTALSAPRGATSAHGAATSVPHPLPRRQRSSLANPPGQAILPSYSTFAARLGLENDHYQFTLYGKNLSDSRGFSDYSSYGAPYSAVTVTQPLTLGLTMSAKF